jgi:hypothetical protein
MNVGEATADYLAEFYTVAEIREAWKAAGDALASRSTVVIHLSAHSSAGGSGSGINLANAQECAAFMTACKAALVMKGEDVTVPASSLAVGTDFSRRYVGT